MTADSKVKNKTSLILGIIGLCIVVAAVVISYSFSNNAGQAQIPSNSKLACDVNSGVLCGNDNKNYANECELGAASGVTLLHTGACVLEKPQVYTISIRPEGTTLGFTKMTAAKMEQIQIINFDTKAHTLDATELPFTLVMKAQSTSYSFWGRQAPGVVNVLVDGQNVGQFTIQ